MRFNSLFDLKYFLKNIDGKVVDNDLALRLKNVQNYEIHDKDYFLLTDSIESYMGELRYHSSEKTFYKKLLVDELIIDNVPNLCAMETHLSIGLCERSKVRSDVSVGSYIELKNIIDSMILEILKNGKVENRLLNLLK